MIDEVVEKSEVRSFERADEVRETPHGRLELVRIGGVIVGRATLEPGWRWSEEAQQIAKTDSCEAPHFGYRQAYRLSAGANAHSSTNNSLMTSMTPWVYFAARWAAL